MNFYGSARLKKDNHLFLFLLDFSLFFRAMHDIFYIAIIYENNIFTPRNCRVNAGT